MAPHYQAATLIASPSYPNAITWSSENLVAVASGHLVTILNPAELDGPRGLVVLRSSDPFPIGVVSREDLFEPSIVPISLGRDTEPCARSVSWSQQGFAPNSGCLLAVCTVDGRVKLYRSPFCEFCDEWVEVTDISQLLCNYYKNINFGDDGGTHSFTERDANTKQTQGLACVPELQEPEQTQDLGCVPEMPEQTQDLGCVPEVQEPEQTQVLGCVRELQEPISCRGPGRRKRKATRVEGYIYDDNGDGFDASKDADFSLKPCSKSKKNKSLKKVVKPQPEAALVNGHGRSKNVKAPLSCNQENKSSPLLTAKQYACRDALLSSLVVAWSPVVSSRDSTCILRNWCILAVGSKSGNVSLWKIRKPEYYTVDVGMVTRDPVLIGVLQAHKSWVNSISWEISSVDSSNSLLLLATGCSDGSVKVWSVSVDGLNQCKGVKEVPFALVAEVTTDSSSPVSSVSLSVPCQPQREVNLAVGRVSGSVETCILNMRSNKIENTIACYAHDQVVTGLSWGLDSHCLYSCSQDNSMRCWIFHRNHLEDIPVRTHFPELKDPTDLAEVSNRCFGLALAPGELMIAVVRSLDLNLLNQMYQVRTQKAVVEFIWVGGQSLGIPLDKSFHERSLQPVVLSTSNFLWWGSNILWSLKKYENGERALVLWDVIAALQGFKKSAPEFLNTLMHNWISDLFSDDPQSVYIDGPSHSRRDMMSQISLRKLHLLNIICGKVILMDHTQYSLGAENRDSSIDFWNDLMASSERELRERLVAFTFAAVLKRTSYSLKGASIENSWFPVGVAQMEAWLSFSDGEVHNQLKFLKARIKDLGRRIDLMCECSVEETCTYCSALVHFKSPDVATCSSSGTASADSHTLSRCRASMRLCSVLQPVWHCVCCGGMVNKLLPETFFTTEASPWKDDHEEESFDLSAAAVPLCPFCGILLQRSTPVFLMSTSPV